MRANLKFITRCRGVDSSRHRHPLACHLYAAFAPRLLVEGIIVRHSNVSRALERARVRTLKERERGRKKCQWEEMRESREGEPRSAFIMEEREDGRERERERETVVQARQPISPAASLVYLNNAREERETGYTSLEMDELQSLRNPPREKWHARTSRSCDNRGNPPATCHGTPTAAFQRYILSLFPLSRRLRKG